LDYRKTGIEHLVNFKTAGRNSLRLLLLNPDFNPFTTDSRTEYGTRHAATVITAAPYQRTGIRRRSAKKMKRSSTRCMREKSIALMSRKLISRASATFQIQNRFVLSQIKSGFALSSISKRRMSGILYERFTTAAKSFGS